MSQEFPWLIEANGPVWLLSTEEELRPANREEIALWHLLVAAREERDRLRRTVRVALDALGMSEELDTLEKMDE